MRRRTRSYDSANVFYLPAATDLGFVEGFARLDHIQSVAANHLSQHRRLRLVPEALEALQEWVCGCSRTEAG